MANAKKVVLVVFVGHGMTVQTGKHGRPIPTPRHRLGDIISVAQRGVQGGSHDPT